MLDWLADNLALIMFMTMFVVIFCGYPVAFVMGGTALIFAVASDGCSAFFRSPTLSNILLRMWGGVAVDPVLVSIPMFIFMGSILERSGSAKDMLLATEILLKRVPGGLAVAVMVMGTILGGADRRGRRRGGAALGHRAAADARVGLRQAPRRRHHRLRRDARHSHPARDHAGGHGRDAQHLGRRAVCRRDDARPSCSPASTSSTSSASRS